MSQEWLDPQGPSGSQIDSSSENKTIINPTDSLGHSFSHSKTFSLNQTGWADVKRLRCSSDSLLQIERSHWAMHAIVNLSSLVDKRLVQPRLIV